MPWNKQALKALIIFLLLSFFSPCTQTENSRKDFSEKREIASSKSNPSSTSFSRIYPSSLPPSISSDKVMAMSRVKTFRSVINTKEVGGILSQRTFSAGAGKAKKDKKGGSQTDAPKASTLAKEVKATTVVGGNILKDGTDPKILPDSEYPDWLWGLLDKRPALSELSRKKIETLPYEDLKRFVKLDNRRSIKENNSLKAKN